MGQLCEYTSLFFSIGYRDIKKKKKRRVKSYIFRAWENRFSYFGIVTGSWGYVQL